MESHFEINVLYKNSHFFATAPRSCRDEREAEKVYEQIKNRFPESEGYKIMVTRWQARGTCLEWN